MTRWNSCCCAVADRIGFLILERKKLGTEPVFGTPTLNYYIRSFQGISGYTGSYTGDYSVSQLKWGSPSFLGTHKKDTLDHLGSSDYCTLEGISLDHRLKATLILPSVYAGVTVDNKILNPRTYWENNKHPFVDMARCVTTLYDNGLWGDLIENDVYNTSAGNSYLIPYLPTCCTGPAALYNVVDKNPEFESYAWDIQYSSAVPKRTSNDSYQIFFTVQEPEPDTKTADISIKSGTITSRPWLNKYELTTLGDSAWSRFCQGFSACHPYPKVIGYNDTGSSKSICYEDYYCFATDPNRYYGSQIKYASYQFLPHEIQVYAVLLKECNDLITGERKIQIFNGEQINSNQFQYTWPTTTIGNCTDCYDDVRNGQRCRSITLGTTLAFTYNNYWEITNLFGEDGLAGASAPCNFASSRVSSGAGRFGTRLFYDIDDYGNSKLFDNSSYNYNDPTLGLNYTCYDVVGATTKRVSTGGTFICCKFKLENRFTQTYTAECGTYRTRITYDSTETLGLHMGSCPANDYVSTDVTTDFGGGCVGRLITEQIKTYTPVGDCTSCGGPTNETLCTEGYYIQDGVQTCTLSGGQCIICTTGNSCGCSEGGTNETCTSDIPENGLVPYTTDQTTYDYNKYLFYGISGGVTLPNFEQYLGNILEDWQTNRGVVGYTYVVPYDRFTSGGKKLNSLFAYQVKKGTGISLTFNNNSDANTWFIFNPSNLSLNQTYYKTTPQLNTLFRSLEKTYLFKERQFVPGYFATEFLGSSDFSKINAAIGITFQNLSCDAYINALQDYGWSCSGSGYFKTCTKGLSGMTFNCATCWDNMKDTFGYTFTGTEIKPNNKAIGDTYAWGWTAGQTLIGIVGATSDIRDYVSTLQYLKGFTYPCMIDHPYSYDFFKLMRDSYGVTFT